MASADRTPRFHLTRLTTLVAVALLVAGAAACAADDDDAAAAPENAETVQSEPISMEMLTARAEFTDNVAAQISFTFDGRDEISLDMPDASQIATAEVTIQPGAVFPWHTHPGPVLINVVEGTFVYILADDCVQREYGPGEALVDAGGDNVHTALNPSTTDQTVVVATFLDAPADPDAPLTVPVDEEQQQALTEECGL